MNKEPFVSIIVPVVRWNNNLKECIQHCIQLDYPDYEVIVLPDEPFKYHESSRVEVLPTGPLGPAAKRNIGIREAHGELVAFIDDDTYPARDWLKNAVSHFGDEAVAAVGGPAVTPPGDDVRQQASGAVYSSFLGGGGYRYRYIPLKKRLVDDYPSCNFTARRSVLTEIGGFRTNFWPGEDTALCLDIVKKLKQKIIYDPGVLIYHHRRALFGPHLAQIQAYACHRGYFAKRFPGTSLRLSYLVPSFFVLFILFGWLFNLYLYLGMISLYLLLSFVSIVNLKPNKLKILTFWGIISTHFVYGIWFIKGIFSRRLKEE